MTRPPTGEQYEIRSSEQSAVVVEMGAALRDYTVSGRPVLDGFAVNERITGGRGQILVPWPNRIRDGRYAWNGQDLQLPLTEVSARNASHGLLRWTSWSILDRDDARVVLGSTVFPQPGYPFLLGVTVEYALTGGGLSVAISAENRGDVAAPYGVGHHPYVTVGGLVDDASLTIPAKRRLVTDERSLPVASEQVAGTPYDFQQPRPIGGLRLDFGYGDVQRDESGRAVVRLAEASGRRGVDVWLGDGADYIQVFTGDTLPQPQRRHGLAVEPMSCPADAFNSGAGLVTLEPGATHTLRWGITAWERS